jgi:2-polyprenyl-3-methyl-5-hydroxy-6-metoxy-1,4-benzoquinol methylase
MTLMAKSAAQFSDPEERDVETAMTENGDQELDLAQLMARIRERAEKRKNSSFVDASAMLYSLLKTNGSDSLPIPLIKLQSEIESRELYQLNDLLVFHDESFVRNAYRAILKREPDDAGFVQHLRKLRSGLYSKIDILSSLRFSPEGRRRGIEIKGLRRSSLFGKLYRVPVLGYLFQLASGIIRLPVLIANYRRLESHSAAQHERLAGHINELSDTLRSIAGLQSDQIKALVREQQEITQDQNALKSDISIRLNETADLLKQHASLQENNAANLQVLKSQIEIRIENLFERLQKTKMEIVQQERRLTILLEEAHKRSPDAFDHDQLQIIRTEEDHALDSLYCALEYQFRGTTDDIREQVKGYLPILKDAGVRSDILDVGSCRGEWLEVLREAGLSARGVDHNRVLIEQCKALRLDVVESEALTYLRSQADRSLSAVTAFHFVEHMPLETLVKFLDEVGRTLKPDGLVILETPNPENLLVGSCNFYLDPTHRNPISVATMQLLLESRGFYCQEVLKLHPISSPTIEIKDKLTSHLNHYLYGPTNYAIVGRKI